MKNEHEFKVGDLVERYRGGTNAGKKVGDTFRITRVMSSNVFDENHEGHDPMNLRLATPKSEINNNYSIY